MADKTDRSPLIIVDIGARDGLHKRWRDLEWPIDFIGFEPDEEECKRLNREHHIGRQKYLPYALWSSAGERTLYRTRSPFGSSLFEPNYNFIRSFNEQMHHYEPRGKMTISCHRLDDILSDEGVHDIDFIKVDTEGAELEILKGAGAYLSKAVAVEVEVWFDHVSEGAPLFGDVDRYLRDNDFHLFDIAKTNYFRRNDVSPKGQLVAGDALYLKFANGLSSEKAGKLALISAVYGHGDLATEICQSLDDAKIVDFVKSRTKRIGAFRGKNRLAKIFRRMSDALVERESEELSS